MSSRFVFLSLSEVDFINLIANGESLAYVCTGQLRETRHLLFSVTFFPTDPKSSNFIPVLPSIAIGLKLTVSAFGMNALFPAN